MIRIFYIKVFLGLYGYSINAQTQSRTLGNKSYQVSNHLDNVMAVVSDRRTPTPENSNTTIAFNETDIKAFNDYYPYGMLLYNRNASGNYRYGYQGSEKNEEVFKSNKSYTTYYRQLDTKIGRWLTIDPKFSANENPYASMSNNPIKYNDVLGDRIEYASNASRQEKRSIRRMLRTNLGNRGYRRLRRNRNVYKFRFYDNNRTQITSNGNRVFRNAQEMFNNSRLITINENINISNRRVKRGNVNVYTYNYTNTNNFFPTEVIAPSIQNTNSNTTNPTLLPQPNTVSPQVPTTRPGTIIVRKPQEQSIPTVINNTRDVPNSIIGQSVQSYTNFSLVVSGNTSPGETLTINAGAMVIYSGIVPIPSGVNLQNLNYDGSRTPNNNNGRISYTLQSSNQNVPLQNPTIVIQITAN